MGLRVYARRPAPLDHRKRGERRHRLCLRCGRLFTSPWFGVRLCGRCDRENAAQVFRPVRGPGAFWESLVAELVVMGTGVETQDDVY